MKSCGFNPLEHYEKVQGPNVTTFTFKKISMSQLHSILQRMKATGSAGEDNLSVKILKQALEEIEPMLLHLMNATILKTTYPQVLKTTKVVPLPKQEKEKTTSDGWRPINVVPTISKVIERVYLKQILQHLDENELIGHQHHGAIRGKSTQTLVSELHDLLVEDM